jgi:hypothetical protein
MTTCHSCGQELPKPPTLREAVLAAISGVSQEVYPDEAEDAADAVLAVVRERLLGGWQAYADEHCFSSPAGIAKTNPYSIGTRAAHDYMAALFDEGGAA